MQTVYHKLTSDPLQFPPAGNSVVGDNRIRRNSRLSPSSSSSALSSPRSRPSCTCLNNRPGSVRCSRHGYVVPGDYNKLKRHQAKKEILRRALAPPNRRLTLRWCNFRPTPSRLSNMSMA